MSDPKQSLDNSAPEHDPAQETKTTEELIQVGTASPRPWFRNKFVILFALLFGVIGSMGLYLSFADTPDAQDTPDVNAVAKNQLEIQAKRETMQLVGLAKKLQQNPGDPAIIKQIQDTAAQRKADISSLIKTNPQLALQVHIPGSVKKSLPAPAQADVESEVELQGKLTVTHGESFDENTHSLSNPFYNFSLSDKGNALANLYFGGDNPVSLSGATIKVKGVQLGADVATTSSSADTTVITAATTVPATLKKAAVILFNFSDNTTQPWTPAQVKAAVFGATAPSANTFYQEQSFSKVGIAGKVAADGDVYGWYKLSDTSASSCPNSTWSSDAAKAATAAGVDLSGYDQIIYAFPWTTSCGGWAGMATIGGGTVWINGYATNVHVLSHELGHNYGTHHANSEDCTNTSGTRVSFSATCTTTEYGDPFDVMGGYSYGSSGSTPFHFDAFHKGQAGYLQAGNTQTVSVSGAYTVAPLEKVSAGVQSLRVPAGTMSGSPAYYYIEYRQTVGYDAFSTGSVTQGVLIHRAPDYPTIVQSQLIDATPATTTFNDAALVAGQTFTDSVNNVTIKTDSVSATGAAVTITLATPTCVHNVPTVASSPMSQYGTSGSTLSYVLTIKNNDSSACTASTFNVASALPIGLTQSPASTQVSLTPGSSTSVTVAVTSAATQPAGFYTFDETVSNPASTSSATRVSPSYNVSPSTDTTAPVASVSAPADGSAITRRTTISANATDNVGVASIEIWIDGVLKASNTTSSISFTWSTNKVSQGSHTILVKAYDAAGNLGQKQITVTK